MAGERPELEPDGEMIARFLRAHPDFFEAHPDLFEVMTPTLHQGHGDRVLDFQLYALEKMKGRVADLDATRSKLIAATRSNLASQKAIHRAVLMALDATSLETLVHIMTADWVDTLGVDVITLCFEAERPLPSLVRAGLRRLEPGMLAERIGSEDAILLRDNVEGDRHIFGPAAPLVAAEALVRIDLGLGPEKGLLAFGSRDPGSFYPGQGTELLRFLRDVAARLIRRHIKGEMT